MSENTGSPGPPPPPEPPSDLPPPPEPPPGPAAGAPPPPPQASTNTLMLVLAYLGPLALVPFLLEKEDREVQWHAKHGLVLLAAEIVLWIGLIIVETIASSILGVLGCAFALINLGLALAILVLHIACIVKAVNGQRLIIPQVSQYADRF
ncbi:MAG: hypothetical protein KDD11_20190 [Acidobacteria bacterium]|nr:hypothetical protein [Acidobacteriota bacterium]